MRAIHLVIVAILAVSVVLVVAMLQKKQEAITPPEPAPLAGPPAGALFLEADAQPAGIIQSGGRYTNYWIPEPGWQVAVDSVREQDNGKVITIAVTQSTPLWGQMWVAALVPSDTFVSKGDFIMLTGRVDRVEKFVDGGPVEAHRLVLRDAKVLKNLSRGG